MFNNFLRMIFEENVRRFNEEVRRFNEESRRFNEETIRTHEQAVAEAFNAQAVYDSNLETSQQLNNQIINDMSMNFGMNNMF